MINNNFLFLAVFMALVAHTLLLEILQAIRYYFAARRHRLPPPEIITGLPQKPVRYLALPQVARIDINDRIYKVMAGTITALRDNYIYFVDETKEPFRFDINVVKLVMYDDNEEKIMFVNY